MSRFGNLEFDAPQSHDAAQSTTTRDERQQLEEAETALRRGDFELALRAYAKVLEFNPTNTHAWAGQVRMLIELGEFKEAKLWADQAVERFPQEPELLAAKAVALARTGDTRAALTFSDAAIAEGSETPYVWLARGDVLLARAEKRADYCFTRALGVAPNDWLWPWLAARIHHFYRKFSLAFRLVSQALALDGSQAVVWLQLGRCQLALGLTSAATESLTQARQLDPGCPELERLGHEVRQLGWWGRLGGQARRWLGR